MKTLPFSDLKVIELASVLAGPSVGQFFAELGAEVIKVENPKTNGDVTRSWKGPNEKTDDVSAYFSCVNWGKKSLLLDITKHEQLLQLYTLVKSADMVIASYKSGDDKKLKVDYNTLKSINSKLIYGQITGYGSLADRVGYDAIIQAEVGFMHINGELNSDPLKMPVALMDLLAGHQLKEALLVGYIQLLKTGQGGSYEVSLVEAGLSSLANQATNYLVGGNDPESKGSLHPNIAPYGETFSTKDGQTIVLAVGNNKQFESLLQILKIDSSSLYQDNSDRVINRESLAKAIQEVITSLESKELMTSFADFNIPAGIVNRVSKAIDLYGELIKLESQDGLKGIRTFIANSDQLKKSSHILPPPHLGEHSTEILNRILA